MRRPWRWNDRVSARKFHWMVPSVYAEDEVEAAQAHPNARDGEGLVVDDDGDVAGDAGAG